MANTKPKRVTLADVARASGMSKASVSLILNNKPGTRLSEKAAQHVRTVAAELGYKPNIAAQSLRLGKTRTIGFISDQVTVTRYASAMITGILKAAEEQAHTVLMAETFGKDSHRRQAVENMNHRDVDGIILGFMDSRHRDLADLPTDLPIVLVNGTDTQKHASVMPNEYLSGAAAVERVKKSGANTVAVIGAHRAASADPASYPSITRRFDSLHRAIAEQELTLVSEWELNDWNPEDGYQATVQMLRTEQRPDAIICANDRVAMGTYQALAECGLVPGSDVSVISFDDEIIASYLRPQLTTMQLPYSQMGERAVRLLLDMPPEPCEDLIEMPLIERDSMC